MTGPKIFSDETFHSSGLNLPQGHSLTFPGEALITILSIVAGFHVLILTFYFLPAVTILSLKGNKKMFTSELCQTTQSNDRDPACCWAGGQHGQFGSSNQREELDIEIMLESRQESQV